MKKTTLIIIILIIIAIILFLLIYLLSKRSLPEIRQPNTTPTTEPINYNAPPPGTAEKQEQFQKTEYPDAFLANITPYQNDLFVVTSNFTSTPTEHFYFTVQLLSTDKVAAQQSVLQWIKGQGLTDQQIQSLDLRYE